MEIQGQHFASGEQHKFLKTFALFEFFVLYSSQRKNIAKCISIIMIVSTVPTGIATKCLDPSLSMYF